MQRLERYIAWDEYCEAMQALEWAILTEQTEMEQDCRSKLAAMKRLLDAQ